MSVLARFSAELLQRLYVHIGLDQQGGLEKKGNPENTFQIGNSEDYNVIIEDISVNVAERSTVLIQDWLDYIFK